MCKYTKKKQTTKEKARKNEKDEKGFREFCCFRMVSGYRLIFGITLIYFTLHIFVTKRILKFQFFLHTYIMRFILLVIRKLLYVGNLHLPTFTYIQHFDRIFLNDLRNFSL